MNIISDIQSYKNQTDHPQVRDFAERLPLRDISLELLGDSDFTGYYTAVCPGRAQHHAEDIFEIAR